LDVVHGGVDGRERGQDLLDRHADLERRVALGVERVGGAHAAGHPQQDAGVGGRRRVLKRGGGGAGHAGGDGGEAGGGHAGEEVAAGEFGVRHGGNLGGIRAAGKQ